MFKVIRVVFLIWTLVGCAGFPGNNIDQVKDEFFKNNTRPMIYYQLSIEDNLGFVSRKKFENTQVGEFIRAVRDTDCCFMTTDESKSDIKINLTISKYENPAALFPTLLTRLTLYVLPSWATTRYTFTAKVVDKNSEEHSYTLADDWTIVQWWPAIVLYPFYTPVEVDELVLRNMNKALLSKLHDDAII